MWAIGNQLVGIGFLLFLLNISIWCLLERVVVVEPSSLSARIWFVSMLILRIGFAFYLAFRGNELSWKAGSFENAELFRITQKREAMICSAILILEILFVSMSYVPSMLRRRDREMLSACGHELKKVAISMEQEISEKGSVKGIHNVDDVCHHILPGFNNKEACKGLMQKEIDSVCVSGSIKIEIIDDYEYRIHAQARDRFHCRMCTDVGDGWVPGWHEYNEQDCKVSMCPEDYYKKRKRL
jgi:hypothetical protein